MTSSEKSEILAVFDDLAAQTENLSVNDNSALYTIAKIRQGILKRFDEKTVTIVSRYLKVEVSQSIFDEEKDFLDQCIDKYVYALGNIVSFISVNFPDCWEHMIANDCYFKLKE